MKLRSLSGNQLKIIALISMTIDHIGVQIYPQFTILRIIGRLAMPVFAYMIAEGCTHTKNRKKYLLTISLIAFLCQMVYYLAEKSLDQCIFVTFALSIMLIYIFDKRNIVLSLFALIACLYITQAVNIDYGFFGIILPLLIYIGKTRNQKLMLLTAGLVLVSLTNFSIQWYSLLSIPLIALYNGQRGAYRLKYFFYIYYPLHLAIIYLIDKII